MDAADFEGVKAAYLLQLRRGSFTRDEFANAVKGSEPQLLNRLAKLGYVTEQSDAANRGFLLTPEGRNQLNIVLTGGVYDVIHLGHLAALREAKRLGNMLVVVVASDATVEKLKGHKPTFSQGERRELVEGLKPVDRAIVGYEDAHQGFEKVLLEVEPDVVAVGYDQVRLEEEVQGLLTKRGLQTAVVRLSKFSRSKYSSTSDVRTAGFTIGD